jgi:hypothetical protein
VAQPLASPRRTQYRALGNGPRIALRAPSVLGGLAREAIVTHSGTSAIEPSRYGFAQWRLASLGKRDVLLLGRCERGLRVRGRLEIVQGRSG